MLVLHELLWTLTPIVKCPFNRPWVLPAHRVCDLSVQEYFFILCLEDEFNVFIHWPTEERQVAVPPVLAGGDGDRFWQRSHERRYSPPPPPSLQFRARIFKLWRNPGIDSKESIPPAYVARRAGTITRFLDPIDCLITPALSFTGKNTVHTSVGPSHTGNIYPGQMNAKWSTCRSFF
jgi:hypothetical protein